MQRNAILAFLFSLSACTATDNPAVDDGASDTGVGGAPAGGEAPSGGDAPAGGDE